MQSLISDHTFCRLVTIRNALLEHDTTKNDTAGLFVPCAGEQLIKSGGLYYIGIATRGEFERGEPQDMPSCVDRTRKWLCSGNRHEISGAPFWNYLDKLSCELLGGPYEKTFDRWGWSNLIKIGSASRYCPSPAMLVAQYEACVNALKEEITQLTKSLVVIVSADDFGFLSKVGLNEPWEKDCEGDGLWWKRESGNLFVWAYHPAYARRRLFFDAQLKRSIELARKENFSWCKSEPFLRH
jgi:hypothetical protein